MDLEALHDSRDKGVNMSDDPSKQDDGTSSAPPSSRLRLPESQGQSKADKSWFLLVVFAVIAIVVVALFSNSKG